MRRHHLFDAAAHSQRCAEAIGLSEGIGQTGVKVLA
jgi:hypothetical protein